MRPNQTKSFYTAKETINKTKRRSTEWEKIFANHMTDKGLISKVCKEKLNNNGIQLKKWTET